jgi:hypothetical protein
VYEEQKLTFRLGLLPTNKVLSVNLLLSENNFKSYRNEGTRDWKILLHILYCAPNVVSVIDSRMVGWARCIERVVE